MKRILKYLKYRRRKKLFLKIYFSHLQHSLGKPADAFSNAVDDYLNIAKMGKNPLF